jgi:hypothetical protein
VCGSWFGVVQTSGGGGRNVIDWKLIERHWRDLMQVAISISEGLPASAAPGEAPIG